MHPSRIRVVATEATRTALNSDELIDRIKRLLGWQVHLLPKELEGKVGAYGVLSSYDEVRGLVMDLGGGSTQITWMKTENGELKMSDVGSVSMPYGAAALTKHLQALGEEDQNARKEFEHEVIGRLKDAVKTIAIPEDLVQEGHKRGLNLYLTGGGFRGWGFVLMNEHHIKPYPVPIINGFHVTTDAFHDTAKVTVAVNRATDEETPDIFRVSARRASQVPSVAFLVNCLSQALPDITDVYFCQGGVREGLLFLEELDTISRAESPFVTATLAYAPESTTKLVDLLSVAARPPPSQDDQKRAVFSKPMLTTFVQAMYVHAAFPKDIAAGAALRSTTTGVFANTHGVSHEQRALLALFLCERYGGYKSISPTEQDFYKRMSQLLPGEEGWWCMLLGRVAALLGKLLPSGVAPQWERVKLKVQWRPKKDNNIFCIDFSFPGMMTASNGELSGPLKKLLTSIEKAGKRKNWVEGKGYKVLVTINGKDAGE